eukprot:s150_g14.t1
MWTSAAAGAGGPRFILPHRHTLGLALCLTRPHECQGLSPWILCGDLCSLRGSLGHSVEHELGAYVEGSQGASTSKAASFAMSRAMRTEQRKDLRAPAVPCIVENFLKRAMPTRALCAVAHYVCSQFFPHGFEVQVPGG